MVLLKSFLFLYGTLKSAVLRTPVTADPKPNATLGVTIACARLVRSASVGTAKSEQHPAADSVKVAVVLWW